MIVFTIIYGESFIRKAFDFCLPSLLASGNLPRLKNEKPELLIFTVQKDLPLVGKMLEARPDISAFFGGRVQAYFLEVPDQPVGEKAKHKFSVTGNLLCRVIDVCLKKDRSFLFAVPDLVYSNGAIEACWQLHRMTGKVVSIFNGRVLPKTDEPPFSPAMMSQLTRPQGVRDYFFSNMIASWRGWTTTDPDVIPDHASRGHLIFRRDGYSFIFSRPNPVIGRFTRRDLMFFAGGGNIRSWDHDWQDGLLREGRLQVQPNLDLGMSIELEDGAPPPTEVVRELVDSYGGGDLAQRRENKLAGLYADFVFTTQRAPSQSNPD